MEKDLISIIIPIYNTEKYFEKCILSVINQTYKNIEILLINDCSKDNVEDIILKYKNIDNRINYFKNNQNMGVSYSRNLGIEKANGKYIYFLDSDDYIEDNCLELLHSVIKENDSFSCMLKGYKEVNGVKSMASRTKEELLLLQSPSICIRLFNKSIIDESNIRFSNLKIAEDLEFMYKIILYNDNISYVDEALYTYVIHEDSSLRIYNDNQLDTLKAMDSVVEYAKKIGKYDLYKENIEFTAVSHILVGTIGRILRTVSYKKEDIDKCINYINEKYPNWKQNKLVIKYFMNNEKILSKFSELNII